MKTSERIQRNRQPDKPMSLISLRDPDYVSDDLKESRLRFGFVGYQALIRAYVFDGLRLSLTQMEEHALRTTTSRVQPSPCGSLPAQAIQEVRNRAVTGEGRNSTWTFRGRVLLCPETEEADTVLCSRAECIRP